MALPNIYKLPDSMSLGKGTSSHAANEYINRGYSASEERLTHQGFLDRYNIKYKSNIKVNLVNRHKLDFQVNNISLQDSCPRICHI